MRKLAVVIAAGSGVLLAQAALACDDKAHTAEQSQAKPAVAQKTQKQSKDQAKAKKAERRTAVARADKG